MLTPDSIVPNPANPQSFNRYSYVENNPINFTDPTGHCGADTGSNAAQLTSECEQLAEGLENAYGIGVYWPGRSGWANITNYCHGNSNCPSQVAHDTQYHAWTRDEMMALAIAFQMYEAEIGRNAVNAAVQGTSFVRGDAAPDLGASGEYYTSGLPGFSGASIIIYDNAGINTRWGFPNDMAWVATHEIAHRIDDYATFSGIKNVRGDFISDVSGLGPTSYAQTGGVAEDVAETLTVYVWDRQASNWRAPHRVWGWLFGGVSILGEGRQHSSLNQDRVDFTEELFNALQTAHP